MDAGKILHQLTYAEGLPTEALKAASDQSYRALCVHVREVEIPDDSRTEGANTLWIDTGNCVTIYQKPSNQLGPEVALS